MVAAKMGHKKVKVAGDSPQHRVQIALTAEANRLVPLNGGRNVYFFDPISGRTLHLKTYTAEFVEALRPACKLGLGPRIRQELVEFSGAAADRWDIHAAEEWSDRILDLEAAGVL